MRTHQSRPANPHRIRAVLFAVVAVVVFIFACRSITQTHAFTASSGKQLATQPQPLAVTSKRTQATSLIVSCPEQTLPQAGVSHIAPPNTDPRYVFDTTAIGIDNGHPYQIVGGHLRNDPTQGIILVSAISLDPCQGQVNAAVAILTPQHHGDVHIFAVQQRTILYTTTDGSSGQVDYLSGIFKP